MDKSFGPIVLVVAYPICEDGLAARGTQSDQYFGCYSSFSLVSGHSVEMFLIVNIHVPKYDFFVEL